MKSSLKTLRGRWSLEGGYVETSDLLIFTVKGLVHPPDRVVAYLRYVVDPSGDRVRGGVKFRRIYGFDDQISIIKSKYPHYAHYDEVWGVEVQSVPLDRVTMAYDPSLGLQSIMRSSTSDKLAQKAKSFAEELSSASGVDVEFMGVSGSLLLSLHTAKSDIDFIVYGVDNSFKARRAMIKLLDEGGSFRRLNKDEMEELFESRSRETPMNFNLFVKQEGRKVIQGIYRGSMYFIRFVKDLNEVGESYGERLTRGIGRSKIRALVIDDSESIFTPCTYIVKCLEVLEGEADSTRLTEVTSFRGRFAEQASRGEVVEVVGRLEEVNFKGKRYQRIVVGSSGDYMISLNLI
ncbi:MAG: hypothetical protein N3F04_00015 [Candidatus Nezhaarchaeota archaeon]|nr:hypothetical protein [Candidatus Nezhaarchaeota archaeon]MCX8141158.1 hypothetical protein [Candidatus Nezhaarchaeota archaeon]MDW8050839.1 hypothetical protein [Nitrososphaerota archaeon]